MQKFRESSIVSDKQGPLSEKVKTVKIVQVVP